MGSEARRVAEGDRSLASFGVLLQVLQILAMFHSQVRKPKHFELARDCGKKGSVVHRAELRFSGALEIGLKDL